MLETRGVEACACDIWEVGTERPGAQDPPVSKNPATAKIEKQIKSKAGALKKQTKTSVARLAQKEGKKQKKMKTA